MSTAYERLTSRLAEVTGYRPPGDRGDWRCPGPAHAHGDTRPSLSVAAELDRVLVHCQAGCDLDEILGLLGLSRAQLFDQDASKPRAPAKQVATYRYVNNIDELLFEVVRFEPKAFRQRRPDGNGGWIYKLGDVPRVLYRLPQVLDGAADGRTIFVAEGEKDVLALEQAGEVATCCPGGAGKWRPEHTDTLAGAAKVVVVADRDTAGYRHALDVANAVAGRVGELRVVHATAGKDAADHLAAGRTVDGFEPIELADLADLADLAEGGQEPLPGLPPRSAKRTQAEQLVDMAYEHYELARSTAGDPIAISKGPGRLVRMLRGSGDSLRAELAHRYSETFGKVPSSGALADALAVLEGAALRSCTVDLATRVGAAGDAIAVDMGTADGRAIIVGPSGWDTVDQPPILFRRSALTGPMPTPQPAGELDQLRRFVNVADDAWPLLLAWCVAAFLPDIPHPIALLTGRQGAGKSKAGGYLSRLLDPTGAPVRRPPRDDEEWAMSALGSWVVVLDNVSTIQPWLSDALCRAVTGEGTVRRALYTNTDLVVLSFRRVVLLTSIDAGALRGDLAERLLTLELEAIPDDQRREETRLDRDFDAAWPSILGALLDFTCEVLTARSRVRPPTLPRMADFGRIVAAVDLVLGTNAVNAYRSGLDRAASDIADADPIARALRAMVERRAAARQLVWNGTAGELFDELAPARDAKGNLPKGWPSDATRFGGRLRRLAPVLEHVGVAVTFTRNKTERRVEIGPMGDAGVTLNSPPDLLASPIEGAGQPTNGDAGDAGDAESASQFVLDDLRKKAQEAAPAPGFKVEPNSASPPSPLSPADDDDRFEVEY